MLLTHLSLLFANNILAEANPLDYDPTLLCRITSHYDCSVRTLLSSGSHAGLSNENLLVFRQLYGFSAYVCRFQGCKHASNGFPSEKDLVTHESQHRVKLVCYEPRCAYNDVGFSSAERLKAHLRNHHGIRTTRQLPKLIRRTRRFSELRPPDRLGPAVTSTPLDMLSPTALLYGTPRPTPTPSTPITPKHPNSFNKQKNGAAQPRSMDLPAQASDTISPVANPKSSKRRRSTVKME
jgi:hypothetical protein